MGLGSRGKVDRDRSARQDDSIADVVEPRVVADAAGSDDENLFSAIRNTDDQN